MGRRREISDIDTIVIHCAATYNGMPVTAAEIDGWHQQRGFRRDMAIDPDHAPKLRHIGYHLVILLDGSVQRGRPLIESGAHVRGHNARSIGICMIGTDAFAPAQWRALAVEVGDLRRRIPELRVVGHRDLSPDIDGDGTVEPHEWLKTCPGFEVAAWLAFGMQPLQGHVLGETG